MLDILTVVGTGGAWSNLYFVDGRHENMWKLVTDNIQAKRLWILSWYRLWLSGYYKFHINKSQQVKSLYDFNSFHLDEDLNHAKTVISKSQLRILLISYLFDLFIFFFFYFPYPFSFLERNTAMEERNKTVADKFWNSNF